MGAFVIEGSSRFEKGTPEGAKTHEPIDTGKIEAGMKQVNEVKSREAYDNVLTRDSGGEYTREYFENLSKNNPEEYGKVLDRLVQSGASPDKVRVFIDRGGFNVFIDNTHIYTKRGGEPGKIIE